jgi:hypothetical protein
MFQCYDFDSTRELGVDEVTLSFKSALCGLVKLTDEHMVAEESLEILVMQSFSEIGSGGSDRLKIDALVEFFLQNPEVRSWMLFFMDPPERETQVYEPLQQEVDYSAQAEVGVTRCTHSSECNSGSRAFR